jgi:hypothetical protein
MLKRTELFPRIGGLHVRAIDLAAACQEWVNRPVRTDNASRALESACFRLMDVVDAVGAIEYTAGKIGRIVTKATPSARKYFRPAYVRSAAERTAEGTKLFTIGLDAYYEFQNLLWWTRALDDRVSKSDFGLFLFLASEDRAKVKTLWRAFRAIPPMKNIRVLANYTLHSSALPPPIEQGFSFRDGRLLIRVPDSFTNEIRLGHQFTYHQGRDVLSIAREIAKAAHVFAEGSVNILEESFRKAHNPSKKRRR